MVKIAAAFLKRVKNGSVRIRMKWTTTNISDRKIQVVGYYCPFYYREQSDAHPTKKGFYNAELDKWVPSSFLVSNDHVRMELWPDEKRVYKWAEVEPHYYGIDGPGYWSYRLRVYYRAEGEEGFFYSEANEATLESGDRFSSEAEPALVDSFVSEPALVLSELRRLEGVLTPFPDDESTSSLPTRFRKATDMLTRSSSGFVAVRAKRTLRPRDIHDFESHIQLLQMVFGRQYGSKVRGILIAQKPTPKTISAVKRSSVPLKLLEITMVRRDVMMKEVAKSKD